MESKDANPNYDYLFKKADQESNEINENIKEFYLNEDNLEEAKKQLHEKYPEYGEEFFEYTYLNDLISKINSNNFKHMRMTILRAIKMLDIVKSVYVKEDDEKSYIIETIDGDIKFTSVVNFLEHNAPSQDILKNENVQYYIELINDIERRQSKCHLLSSNISKMLDVYFKVPNNVVTGYCKYFVEKNKYLHSWNELTVENEENVIDSTINTIMNKEGYYLLKHIDEKEILSDISSKNILGDDRKYRELLDEIDLKTYLTSRDEIICDIEKNGKLFHKNEGEER